MPPIQANIHKMGNRLKTVQVFDCLVYLGFDSIVLPEWLFLVVLVQKLQLGVGYFHLIKLQVKTESDVVLRLKYVWVVMPQYNVARHRHKQGYGDV